MDDDSPGPGPVGPQEIPLAELLDGPIDVQLNPYGNTPLAASVKIRARQSVQVHIQIDDEEEIQFTTPDFNAIHDLPLLGLAPDRSNRVIFTFTEPDGSFAKDTISLVTGPLPDYIPDIQIVKKEPNQMEEGLHFCGFTYGLDISVNTRPFIFDQQGTIRWLLDIEALSTFFFPVKRLQNGNWIFGNLETIYEYDMLGKEINRWELGDYSQHHEIVEKADGNLLLAVTDKSLATINDQIIEIDRSSGAIVKTWDLRTVLDNNRFPIVWNSRDWLHVNAFWFEETDQSLVISGRHQGIFKVSYENELQWILAPHNEWGNAGVNGDGLLTADYLLTAIDQNGQAYADSVQLGEVHAPDFDWSWGQHAVTVTPQGQILAFDNGFRRNFENNTETNSHSRGVAYEVDEGNQTVKQVWEFGREMAGAFYSRGLCDIDFLPNTGHLLLTSGSVHFEEEASARIFEVDSDGRVVFEAKVNFRNLYASGIDAWGHTDVIYRSERLSLYP